MTTRPERDQPVDPGVFEDHEATDRGVEIVRSEEQLLVDTQIQVTGRAILRKYVVTETVTQTFQIRREEVRLEQVSAAEDVGQPAGSDRAPFADAVIELVLHREVPRVVMDVVAEERVRLRVDTITTRVQVSDDVRTEQVVVDQPDPRHA